MSLAEQWEAHAAWHDKKAGETTGERQALHALMAEAGRTIARRITLGDERASMGAYRRFMRYWNDLEAMPDGTPDNLHEGQG